ASSCLADSFLTMIPQQRRSPLFPYTTLFRSKKPAAKAYPARVPERHARHLHARTAAAEKTKGSFWSLRRWKAPRKLKFTREGKRSEEHTSELQSRSDLVCRLLLEKKKNTRFY